MTQSGIKPTASRSQGKRFATEPPLRLRVGGGLVHSSRYLFFHICRVIALLILVMRLFGWEQSNSAL